MNQEGGGTFSNPIAALLLAFLSSMYVLGQSAGTFSGTIVGPSGMPVPNAKVSMQSAAQAAEIQTDAAGHYRRVQPPGR